MASTKQTSECIHPVPERNRFGFIITSGTRCSSSKCSVHKIIPDYYNFKQICRYKDQCTRDGCMRMHTPSHVYNQIFKIKHEKPKAMLHFLESMTVEEFRYFFSLIEQWDFFHSYHLREIYRPLETIDSYRKRREREKHEQEQQEREKLERNHRAQQEREQQQIYERELEQHNLREQLQKMQMFQQNILSGMFQQAIPGMFPQFMNPIALAQAPLLPAPTPLLPAPSMPLASSSHQYVSRWNIDREGTRGRDRSRSRERPVRREHERYY